MLRFVRFVRLCMLSTHVEHILVYFGSGIFFIPLWPDFWFYLFIHISMLSSSSVHLFIALKLSENFMEHRRYTLKTCIVTISIYHNLSTMVFFFISFRTLSVNDVKTNLEFFRGANDFERFSSDSIFHACYWLHFSYGKKPKIFKRKMNVLQLVERIEISRKFYWHFINWAKSS